MANDKFLIDHLKLWKQEGIPAPINELNSIAGWLEFLGKHGEEATKTTMRTRMLLLMTAASDLHKSGKEDEFGIYENRPDLKP